MFYEITKLKTTPPGKALLKLDSDGLPVTDKELKVLRASEKEKLLLERRTSPLSRDKQLSRVWQIGV